MDESELFNWKLILDMVSQKHLEGRDDAACFQREPLVLQGSGTENPFGQDSEERQPKIWSIAAHQCNDSRYSLCEEF